jgi:hypothetical protein
MQSPTSRIVNRIGSCTSTITSRINNNLSTLAATTISPPSAPCRTASRIQSSAGRRLLSSGRSRNASTTTLNTGNLQQGPKITTRVFRKSRSLSSANAVAKDPPRRRNLETKDPIVVVSSCSLVCCNAVMVWNYLHRSTPNEQSY